MELDKLKNKDKIKINGKIYEVLYKFIDVDITPEGMKNIQNSKGDYTLKKQDYEEYLMIALHSINSTSLFPTHELKYYKNRNLVVFSGEGVRIKLNKEDIELTK